MKKIILAFLALTSIIIIGVTNNCLAAVSDQFKIEQITNNSTDIWIYV